MMDAGILATLSNIPHPTIQAALQARTKPHAPEGMSFARNLMRSRSEKVETTEAPKDAKTAA